MLTMRSFSALSPEVQQHLEGVEDKEGMIERVTARMALKNWSEQLEKITQVPVDPALFQLLHTHKKKVQVSLLKGVTLDPETLLAFIFRAYAEQGFTYSVYESNSLPADVGWKDMPEFAYKDEVDGSLFRHGTSPLTDGKLRSVINDRKVVVAKFLDNGPVWHCFFLTYKSIAGKEAGERPHLHYISHAWGFSREEVIRRLKERRYDLPDTPHIPYNRGPR